MLQRIKVKCYKIHGTRFPVNKYRNKRPYHYAMSQGTNAEITSRTDKVQNTNPFCIHSVIIQIPI